MKIWLINSLLIVVGLGVWFFPRSVDYFQFLGFSSPMFISEKERDLNTAK